MNKFKRRKPQIYLAGGMENSPDFGVGWRQRAEKWLLEEGWNVHNPCTKETTIFKRRGVKGSTYHKLKTMKTLDAYQSIMQDLIDFDLKVIKYSDMVLVYWDEYARGGTIHEVGYAREHGIPVVIMSKGSLKTISGWVLGCADEVFFKWVDVKKYLGGKNVNRTIRESKKRKGHSSRRDSKPVQGKKNVVRRTTKSSRKDGLRLVGSAGKRRS